MPRAVRFHAQTAAAIWVAAAMLMLAATGIPAAEAVDRAALRQALTKLDLRNLKLPEEAQISRVDATQLWMVAPLKLQPAFQAIQNALLAAGWKANPGNTNQQTADYVQASMVQDGFELFLYASPEGDDRQTTRIQVLNLGTVDTRRLPRPPGAKPLYESFSSTIIISPLSVADTATACTTQLQDAGWTPYTRPDTSTSDNPTSASLDFACGHAKVEAYITVAPAQNNQVTIQYATHLLPAELPWPADVKNLQLDLSDWTLRAESGSALSELGNFYRDELQASGWSLDTQLMKLRKEYQRLLFNHPSGQRVLVQLDSQQAQVRIRIDPISDGEVAELVAAGQDAAPATQTASPAETAATNDHPAATDDHPAAPDETSQTQAQVQPPDERPAGPFSATSGSARRFPLPEDATRVTYDADDQQIAFFSRSTIRDLVQFYRETLTAAGWSDENGISVVTSAAAMVDFQGPRDRQITLNVSISGRDDQRHVTISTSGLAYDEASADLADAPSEDSAPEAPEEMPDADNDSAPADGEGLAAEDKDGLPVPGNYSQFTRESSPFRTTVTAVHPATIEDLDAFYQQQLPAVNWEPLADGAKVTPQLVRRTYRQGDEQLVLTLRPGNADEGLEGIVIQLVVRKPEAARKMGLLPPAGQTKVSFANIEEKPLRVVFGGSPVNVPAGAGASKPDGPAFNVKPGKYQLKLEIGGKTVATETLIVGPDEIWAVMLNERGILPMQAY